MWSILHCAAFLAVGRPGRPLFVLPFGGLGVYGGLSDFFQFMQAVLADLNGPGATRTYVAVGAPEMARLATLVGPPSHVQAAA